MKTLEWWESRDYEYYPQISYLIHTHNMSEHAIGVVNSVRGLAFSEIIVMDDGSDHKHTQRILDNLTEVDEYLIYSNDLGDVLLFNHAIRFALGEYVVILQDDDEHIGLDWINLALQAFDKDPKLAILGGRVRLCVFEDGQRVIGRDGPFQYAQVVNAAPFWIRKSAFLDLGGFDFDFAPYAWHEGELCMRAWLSGYHVGWYRSGVNICAVDTPERRGISFSIRTDARHRNLGIFLEKYGDRLGHVQEMAKAMNAQLNRGST